MSARDDLLSIMRECDGCSFGLPGYEPKLDHIYELADAALEEIDRRGWDDLMSILDKHYPSDVFDGSSRDPGAQIVVHLREIDRLRRQSDSGVFT